MTGAVSSGRPLLQLLIVDNSYPGVREPTRRAGRYFVSDGFHFQFEKRRVYTAIGSEVMHHVQSIKCTEHYRHESRTNSISDLALGTVGGHGTILPSCLTL